METEARPPNKQTVLDEIAAKGKVINRNHIAGAPVCTLGKASQTSSFNKRSHFLNIEQKLVLIALLTGKVLPTSKTLGDLLANNTLHVGDPILLDTEDILMSDE